MSRPVIARFVIVAGAVAIAVAAAAGALAFDLLEVPCWLGDRRACGALADRLLHRAGDRPSPRTCELYRRSCGGGVATACANLGALVAQRKCVAAHAGEAHAVLEAACSAGDASGCNNLGMVLRDGDGAQAGDGVAAAAAFRKACAAGAATACDNLGALLLREDEAGAGAAFEAGCASRSGDPGQATCCFKLGLAFENGWGRRADAVRARALFAEACARSVAPACYSLGIAQLKSSELPSAGVSFEKACEGGVAGGCNNLGLMYAEGLGLRRDEGRAAELMERACEGGALEACANVGSRYLLGTGVARDEARGRRLIQRACEGGVAAACREPAPQSTPLR